MTAAAGPGLIDELVLGSTLELEELIDRKALAELLRAFATCSTSRFGCTRKRAGCSRTPLPTTRCTRSFCGVARAAARARRDGASRQEPEPRLGTASAARAASRALATAWPASNTTDTRWAASSSARTRRRVARLDLGALAALEPQLDAERTTELFGKLPAVTDGRGRSSPPPSRHARSRALQRDTKRSSRARHAHRVSVRESFGDLRGQESRSCRSPA